MAPFRLEKLASLCSSTTRYTASSVWPVAAVQFFCFHNWPDPTCLLEARSDRKGCHNRFCCVDKSNLNPDVL
eukprot:scaffold6161_cov158-Amphora_coffeaeformis.AAC.4